MNKDLIDLVKARLKADGHSQKNWASLVLAACDGRDALERLDRERRTAGRRRSSRAESTARRGCLPDVARPCRASAASDRSRRSSSLRLRSHRRHRPQRLREVQLRRGAGSPVHRRQQALVGPLEDLEGRLAQPSSAASGQPSKRSCCSRGRATRRSRARGTTRPSSRIAEVIRPAERQAEDDAAGARVEGRARLVPAVPFLQRAGLDAGRGAVQAVRRAVVGAWPRRSRHTRRPALGKSRLGRQKALDAADAAESNWSSS